jgi:predicted nucleic acid-binding protein
MYSGIFLFYGPLAVILTAGRILMCNDGQTKLLPTKLGVGNRTLANKFFYLCSFMKQRIYIDTSVLGGYFDKEFETDTKLFFKRILNQEYLVHLSPISQIELLPAPQRVKDLVQDIPQNCLVMLDFSAEARELANHYISERILGKASLNDAYHIAIATINRIEVLVSWNFRHIVNLDKIRLFNAINLKFGYPVIDIRSPKELIKYED